MKLIIIAAFVAAAGLTSCSHSEMVTFTARPDPNTSTSGTLGSMKASNGLPMQDYDSPLRVDTVQKH
jgi:hypothetical protein